MQILSFLFPVLLPFFSCHLKEERKRIEPIVERKIHFLGNTPFNIVISRYDSSSDYVFVQLHDNEKTAIQAAINLLEEKGGILIKIENKEERNISFSLNNKRHVFDPNRIFTPKGRLTTLNLFGRYRLEAAVELKKFAEAIINYIPEEAVIIALHNNTNAHYSIRSYLSGPDYKKSTSAIYQNEDLDTDDFFITTSPALFEEIKNAGYNVVLEQYTPSFDDGSLSVYMGKQNRTYINVEAEYGHLTEQTAMLAQLLQFLGDDKGF